MRRKKTKTRVDVQLARDLVDFIYNTREIYRQLEAVWKNMVNKMAAGRYDPKKAVLGFMHVADHGAQRYTKEFRFYSDRRPYDFSLPRATSYGPFSVGERRWAAGRLRTDFQQRAAAGEFRHLLYKKYQPKRPKLRLVKR